MWTFGVGLRQVLLVIVHVQEGQALRNWRLFVLCHFWGRKWWPWGLIWGPGRGQGRKNSGEGWDEALRCIAVLRTLTHSGCAHNTVSWCCFTCHGCPEVDLRLCLSLCPGSWRGAGSLHPTGSITAGMLPSAFDRVLDVTAVIYLTKSSIILGACFCCHRIVGVLWGRFWLFSWDPSPLFGPNGPGAENPIPNPKTAVTQAGIYSQHSLWYSPLLQEVAIVFLMSTKGCRHLHVLVVGNLLNSNPVGNVLLFSTLLLGALWMLLTIFYPNIDEKLCHALEKVHK